MESDQTEEGVKGVEISLNALLDLFCYDLLKKLYKCGDLLPVHRTDIGDEIFTRRFDRICRCSRPI